MQPVDQVWFPLLFFHHHWKEPWALDLADRTVCGESIKFSPLNFFQISLTRSPPTYETESGGRCFLLSYDRTLVIKEISSEDVADVHSLLSHYHQVSLVGKPSNICEVISRYSSAYFS